MENGTPVPATRNVGSFIKNALLGFGVLFGAQIFWAITFVLMAIWLLGALFIMLIWILVALLASLF
jgi:hypothetical protein